MSSDTHWQRIINSQLFVAFKDSGFKRFVFRFISCLIILTIIYEFYLWISEQQRELDWVTYKVSELSHALAVALGVANCEFSCFMDGCYIGVEGKMINVLEGCNGLMLALVYSSYIIGVSGWKWQSLVQVIVGIIVIQFFNVFRIGILVVLRDIGGDVYFFFIKYIFNVLIYLAILLLWLLKPYLDKVMHNNVS
ncbi:archaeosortase/exosortase family protein [Schleiferiaceae bacterium]|nr:archaeosortase/exosortase family protein [Schleiferiaceae bacterium]MDC3387009.1 archaeosortase/exosortase family protein [Schleiferiaceae bacterium]